MKSAQYKVFWISNQQAVGSSDSWVGELSRTADVREFLNRRGWTDGISLDNNLLPKLKDALFDGADRKFIVLHLLGTHAAYDLRFPPEFRAFRTNDGLDGKILEKRGLLDNLFRGSRIELSNAYDNAVLYNDTVVSKIIQMIRASETNYSIVYLSDHGEALGEDGRFVGHIDDVAPKQVYQIPLMFVLSDSVIGSLGEESFRSFKENLNLKFETNGMIHTMLDLYGLSYAYLRSEKSLLSRDYKPWPRFCDGLK
jgi:heptose-I-phosphate ethanolaminephosphotransferase